MSIESIINGPLGIGLILSLGKLLPAKIGFSLAEKLANYLSKKKELQFIRAARANQWMISDRQMTSEDLDKQTSLTLINTSRCLFDLYHHIDDHQNIIKRVTLSPKLTHFLETRLGGDEGTLLLAPHLSNFDFGGRAVVLHGYDVQVLSYPQPHDGYQWQNRLRRDAGMNITPMSTETMRAAKARLKQGGGVLTGLDRPIANSNYHPRFFGHPSNVPSSYVRMALQTRSAIIVIACIGLPESNYRIECSDLIYMEPDDDPVQEIEKNAEKVLMEAEKFIRAYPSQWAMTFPVWPFALDEMP